MILGMIIFWAATVIGGIASVVSLVDWLLRKFDAFKFLWDYAKHRDQYKRWRGLNNDKTK